MKTYYYIYKITILTGRLKDHYYIGQHMTNNIDDGYLGSGVIISNYFKKEKRIEGIDYIKRIICYCDTQEELNDCEWYYIYDRYKTDSLCLNKKEGGDHPTFGKEACKNMSISHLKWAKENPDKIKEANKKNSILRKTYPERFKESYIKTVNTKKANTEKYNEERRKATEKINDPIIKDRMKEKDRNTQLEIWNAKTENERKEHSKKTSNAMYGQRLMSDGKNKHWVMKDDIQDRLNDKWFFCDNKGNKKVA